MDRKQKVALEKQRLVEIYRSCRLCGAGGGYKMPIIQQILPSDIDVETELKEKIRECVSIAVSKDDKMPPLICELCVDKVNDFYEFREMCLQINMQTRTKLGLPPQAMPSESGDASDCILGITSQVYVNPKEDDDKVTPKSKAKSILKITIKKEEKGWNKSVEGESPATRSSRHSKPEVINKPGPKSSKKMTRSKRERSPPPPPEEKKSSLVRSSRSKICTPSPSPNREKSSKRNLDTSIEPRSAKKVRIKAPTPSPPPTRTEKRRAVTFSPAVSPAASKKLKQATPDKRAEKKQEKVSEKRYERANEKRHERRPDKKHAEKCPVLPTCNLCGQTYTSKKGDFTSHLISQHSPTPTLDRLSCASCRDWFTTLDDTLAHHKWHRRTGVPYKCTKCQVDHKTQAAFNRHIVVGECVEDTAVPDVRCDQCWNNFATQNWMSLHKCGGVDARPGGNCCKCNKKFVRYKQLMKHEETCTGKRKKGVSGVHPDNSHLAVRPVQVRMQRCDSLLETIMIKPEPGDGAGVVKYDVSQVNSEFGYDKNCLYPYTSSAGTLRIKTEDGFIMDSMKQEIMDEMYDTCDDDHIDGYSSSDEVPASDMVINPFSVRDTKGVEKLSSISLRAVFSEKFLAYGNPPRRKRKKILESQKAAEKKTSVMMEKENKESPFDCSFAEGDKGISKSAADDSEVLERADEKDIAVNVLDERRLSESVTYETEDGEGNVEKTDAADSNVSDVDKTNTRDGNVETSEAGESHVDKRKAAVSDVEEIEAGVTDVDETDAMESNVDKRDNSENAPCEIFITKSAMDKIDDIDNRDSPENYMDEMVPIKSAMEETAALESPINEKEVSASVSHEAENVSSEPELHKMKGDTNDETNVQSINFTQNMDNIAIEGKSDKLEIDKEKSNIDMTDTTTGDVTNEHNDSQEITGEIDRFLQDHDLKCKNDDIDSSERENKDAVLYTDVKMKENILEDKNVIVQENSEVSETEATDNELQNEFLAGNVDGDVGFDVDSLFGGDTGATTHRDSKLDVTEKSTHHNDLSVKNTYNSISQNEFEDVVVENLNRLSNTADQTENDVESKNVTSEMVENRRLVTADLNTDDPTNVIDESSMEASERESRNILEDSNGMQLNDDSSKIEDKTDMDARNNLEKRHLLDESDLFSTNDSTLQESSKIHPKENLEDKSGIPEMLVLDKNEIFDDFETNKTSRSIEENSDSNLDYGDEASLLKSPERDETYLKSTESDITESKDNAIDKQIVQNDNLDDVLTLSNISDEDFDFD